MNDREMSSWEIKFAVYDMNQYWVNALIGSHSVGLANLYKNF